MLIKARQLNLGNVESNQSNVEATNSIRQSLLKHHYRLCHCCKLIGWIGFFVWFCLMCLVIFFYSLYWDSNAVLDNSYLVNSNCESYGYLDVSEKEWIIENLTLSQWGDGEPLYGYSSQNSYDLFEDLNSNTIRWFVSCTLMFIITLCVIKPLCFCLLAFEILFI